MNKKIKILIIDFSIIFLILPLLILIVWGFTNSWVYPNLLPRNYSLRGLEYILNIENLKVLLNSILISFIVVIITILLSIPAARALSLYEFRGKKFFEMLILSPVIVPTISVAMGIHIVFIKFGMANTLIGVIVINLLPCIPYAVRIISDVYMLIGDKFQIQARVLGANKLDALRFVTIPLIMPGIIGASSMCFIISFSQYFLTLIIGGGVVKTYPMIMFPYIQSGDRTISSLYSLVFIIVSLIVLILTERSIKKYYR
ncbi:ABC transporter permease [[Clostridium] dakarense]|uniref:ABC transporter permease n=1 Tax=Faecalimicrobium dakarense TaxID=1301100 RepID=UPI0004B734E0|nr:ABC transporter permease subunit [[Clostridium] dakarense]